MTDKKTSERKLYIVTTPATGADGLELRLGQVAEEGAKILKTHPNLFRPLEVTYKA